MFERFTDKARRVLVIAQEEARTLEHPFIRPEHLLLGLARGEGVASTALNEAGVRYAVIRERFIEAVSPMPNAGRLDKMPFSPQAKKTLELSLREALKLGHNYIGTEHLLLGVLQLGEDPEAKDNRLKDLIGDMASQLRGRVLDLVSGAAAFTRVRSPAVMQAMDRARQLAGQAPMTTANLLLGILADPDSQVCKALSALWASATTLFRRLWPRLGWPAPAMPCLVQPSSSRWGMSPPRSRIRSSLASSRACRQRKFAPRSSGRSGSSPTSGPRARTGKRPSTIEPVGHRLGRQRLLRVSFVCECALSSGGRVWVGGAGTLPARRR